MKYRVYERDETIFIFEVEADSAQKAIDKVSEGTYDKALGQKVYKGYDAEPWD